MKEQWHARDRKQRSANGIHTITISSNEAKSSKHKQLMLDATTTMSHVEQLELLELETIEGKRRRTNPEEEAQRKQQKCDIRKQAASPSRAHKLSKQQRTMTMTMTMSHVEQL